MPASPLIHCGLLDPRDADESAARPFADAVNIPFSELPDRTHELPSKRRTVPVAGPPALAAEVAAWLNAQGRRGVIAESWSYAEDRKHVSLGRLWRPNSLLGRVVPELPAGTALDLACGAGRDAVFIASCGWDVTAIDRLTDALDRARMLERRYARVLRPVRWIEGDLEADEPPIDARFDLITGFRYLHRPLFARFAGWLNPGGSVIYDTFTTRHRERNKRPTRDAYLLKPGELPRLLDGFEIRHYSEAWHGGAHTARIWALFPG